MRAVSGKVIKGKVVTRAKLPEGAKLTVVVHEREPEVDLDAADEVAIARGIEEIGAGKYATADRMRAFLRRR